MIGYKYFLAIPGAVLQRRGEAFCGDARVWRRTFHLFSGKYIEKKNVSFCFLCYLDLSFHFRKKSLPSGMMAVRPMRMHDRK
ncbi:hypothetical protein DW869_00570 [Phocaeicola vulgatus]|jgi:hypothetical protein|uniref:Uncharacterized protein n=1 Tax=Phocaeicola vulgatus TaxID=821 RepID=A0AB73ZB03_PHOVU|nr:hypothetical protein DW869_00570 [Phocaeicola vulgatus]RHK89675.1 hypothetical protein DW043_05320 [Phocaeicola vulgatus]RHL22769.1 hypothetical protein DW031_06330 [Phocaeicola vulgatus]